MTQDFINQLLKKNAFELFNIPLELLDIKHNIDNIQRQLLKQYHPDNNVNNQDQLSELVSHINNSYIILKNPLKKSLLMLDILGVKYEFLTSSCLGNEFLMQQFELNQELESINNSETLVTLEDTINAQCKHVVENINLCFLNKNYTDINTHITYLMFYTKFNERIKHKMFTLIN